jgi:FtsH-binding integral membrane protein
MIIGVLVSAFFAWLTMNSPLIVVLQNPIFFYGILAVEIALVLGVQWLINKLPANLSLTLFLVYAALNGISMSGVMLYYLTNSASLVMIVFLVAASMFAFLAILGYTTKKDLSGWGTFLYAGMWGVFISSLVNIYFQNSMFDTIISAMALLVFAGLTVYDNQFYKNIFAKLENEDSKKRYAILGAIHMYINFIAIFQNLLNLVNKD